MITQNTTLIEYKICTKHIIYLLIIILFPFFLFDIIDCLYSFNKKFTLEFQSVLEIFATQKEMLKLQIEISETTLKNHKILIENQKILSTLPDQPSPSAPNYLSWICITALQVTFSCFVSYAVNNFILK